MLFSKVPRVKLATVTPLYHLANLGEQWGHPSMYLKRDDLLALGMGGNKVRSAEFWFGEALAQQADVVLVAGLVTSNQCRLVAAAARRLKIECHILHNSCEPQDLLGNNLLNELMGVKRIFLGDIDEFERADHVEAYAAELRAAGRKPYIIGDQVLGALGYVNAALELHAQADTLGIDVQHVVITGAGGPTEAGMLWGAALLGKAFQVHIISCEFTRTDLTNLVQRICAGISAKMQFTPSVDINDIVKIYDDDLGEGYDIMTPEAIQAVRELASAEGIFIESTYNAKVMATLKRLVLSGAIPPDEALCMVHTGGLPALFGQGERFK